MRVLVGEEIANFATTPPDSLKVVRVNVLLGRAEESGVVIATQNRYSMRVECWKSNTKNSAVGTRITGAPSSGGGGN